MRPAFFTVYGGRAWRLNRRREIGIFRRRKKLRAADRELAQLRDVLASMDEIDALRKRDGKPETGEYGGYKRADVSAMVAELERRRRELLAEIAAGGAQGGRDASAARERVTLSDALERLYAAISGNIERAKNEILREIRYSCRQDTAIYAELSARLDALADKVAEKVLAAGHRHGRSGAADGRAYDRAQRRANDRGDGKAHCRAGVGFGGARAKHDRRKSGRRFR